MPAVISANLADLNLQQDNEEMNTVMTVISNVEFVQTADDLRLRITNTAINVKCYLIALLVKLDDEYSPVLNVQNIVGNADQSAWFADEKYLLYIMVVALYPVL